MKGTNFIILILVCLISMSTYFKGEEVGNIPFHGLIPGWYQLEKGITLKGRCLFFGELGSLIAGFGLLSYNQKIYNEYMDIDNDGIKDIEDNEVDKVKNYDFEGQRKKIDLTYNMAQMCFCLTGAIFVYSLYDVTVMMKKEASSKSASLLFGLDKKNNLLLSFSNNF